MLLSSVVFLTYSVTDAKEQIHAKSPIREMCLFHRGKELVLTQSWGVETMPDAIELATIQAKTIAFTGPAKTCNYDVQ